jgi:hypothetical protein
MDDWAKEGDVAQLQSLEFIFQRILNVVVSLAGLTLFVMFLVGGISWLTAGGDPEKAKKAQGTLTWAVTGFILLLASWFILRLISQFTGVDLTLFKLDW